MRNKILKIAVTAALVLSSCMTSAAQDVDGISLWDTYTKAQLVQKYGQPLEYEAQDSEYALGGLFEQIRFKDVTFWLEGNYVTDFYFESDKPRALTKTIKGGIGIGDAASVLEPIKGKLYSTKTRNDGVILHYYGLNPDWKEIFTVGIKNNRIVEIEADAQIY